MRGSSITEGAEGGGGQESSYPGFYSRFLPDIDTCTQSKNFPRSQRVL